MDDFKLQLGITIDQQSGHEEFKKIKSTIEKETLKLNFDIDTSSINKVIKQIEEAKRKTKESTDGLNFVDNIKKQLESQGLDATLSRLQLKFSKLSDPFKNQDLTKSLTNAVLLKDKLTNTTDEKELKNVYNELQAAIAKVNNQLIIQKNLQDQTVSQLDKDKFSSQIKAWQSQNSKANPIFGNQFNQMLTELDNVDKVRFGELQKQFTIIRKEAEQLGVTGRNLTDEMKNNVKKFTQWLSAAAISMFAVRGLKNIIKNVYDLDTAMVKLRKVTDETGAKYNQFLDSAAEKAQRLGRSIADVVNETTTWVKLGYSFDESAMLAEISSIYSNVGYVDGDTAVSTLVTSMKAFNIEAQNSIEIVDSLNELGNRFAISSADLGEGLKVSASTLEFANNDIHQTLAMLTGAGEITQNVQELGNALKVGALRLQGMKGALQEIGEEFEDITSVSKTQTQIYNLTQGVVNIMDDLDPTKFKSTYDILLQISEVWSDMAQTDQTQLLEIMFGKNRANQGASIIKAFQSGQIQKALETSNNAAGSALAEQEKWLEGLEAKIQQFKAAFQGLSNTLIDSDLLKFFVDLGTTGVSGLDRMLKKLGTLPTLIGAISSALYATKNIGAIQLSESGGLTFLNQLKKLSTDNESVFNNLVNGFKASGLSADEFAKSQGNVNQATLSYLRTVQDGNYSYQAYSGHVDNLNSRLGANVVKLNLAKLAVTALNGVLMTFVSMTVSFVIKKLHDLSTAQERAIKAGEEAMDKYRQLYSEFESSKSTIDGLTDRYSELSKGVDEFGRSVSLSTDDYAEYLNITDKIANVFPELIQGYDNEGHAILRVKDNVDELTEAYKRKEQAAYDSIITDGATTTQKTKNVLEGINGNPGLVDKLDVYKNISNLLTDEDSLKKYLNDLLVIPIDGSSGYSISIETAALMEILDELNISSMDLAERYNAIVDSKQSIFSHISKLETQIEAEIQDNRILANAYLNRNDIFEDLDDFNQEFASRLVNGLPSEILKGVSDIEISNIVESILANLGDQDITDKITEFFSFDASSITKENADTFKELIQSLYELLDIDEIMSLNDFNDSLGIASVDNYYKSLDEAIKKYSFSNNTSSQNTSMAGVSVILDQKMTEQEIEELFGTLTQKELVWIINADFDGEVTRENIDALLEEMRNALAPKNIGKFDIDFISTNSDSIDKVLDDISSIQDTVTTLMAGNYSSADLLGSIQVLGEVIEHLSDTDGLDLTINSVSDLGNVLKEVANKRVAELLDKLNVDPDSDFGKMLHNIVLQSIEVEGALTALDTAIDSIQNSYTTLKDAMEEYNNSGYVTLDTLQALLNLDGQYLACLIDENGQLQINTETYQQLVSAQLDAAEALVINQAIQELSELETRSQISANDDYITSIDDLRAELAKLSGSYDAVSEAAAKAAKAQALATALGDAQEKGVDSADIERVMNNMEAKLTLINGTRANIGSSLDSIMNVKSSKSSNSSTKEFSKEIDWAEQSIKNLNNALSLLKGKLDNVHLSYADQVKIITEVVDKQAELVKSYQTATNFYESEWNRLKSVIPEEYVVKITSGEEFSKTTFVDEALYNSVKEASDAYDTYISTLQKTDDAVKTHSDTLIQLYNAQQTHLNNEIQLLKNAQESVQNSIDISETLNRLDTEKQYKSLIAYSKQQEELYRQKLATAKAQLETITDKTSDRYYEIKNEIQDCESALASCVQEQLKWQQTIMELPIKQLQKANEELQKSLNVLQKQQSEYDDAIKGVVAVLDEEIDKIEEAKKAEEEYYNQLIQDKQDELDALQKTNNERKLQLELEKAQYAFEQAKNQKSVRILRNGEFVYEADQDAIKSAKESLDTAIYNKQVSDLNNAISDLQDQLNIVSETYQEQIDSVNEIKDAWNDVATSVERLKNMKLADSLFGDDWRELLLAGDDRDLNYVTMLYGTNAENQESLQQQIEVNEELIQQIQDYIDAWQQGEISVRAALRGINETVEDTDGEIQASRRRVQATDEYVANWDNANLQIQSALSGLTSAEQISADEERSIFDQRIVDMNNFSNQYQNICDILSNAAKSMTNSLNDAVTSAESTVAKLEQLARKAESARDRINDASSGGSGHSGDTPNGSGNVSKYHAGIENGLISSNGSDKDRESALQYLATNKLESNEVPIVALKGEAVFTQEQQEVLLNNIRSGFSPAINLIPELKNFNPYDINAIEHKTEIVMNFGDLTLPNVKNTEDFASELGTKFPMIMKQKLGKR